MATIDYKQKIKDYMNSSEVDTLYKSMLNNLFPELKESKDERIRKAIINVFASHKNYEVFFGVSVEDILAWLERQGKNSMGISEATKQELEDNLNKALEKETPESCNEFLEKQSEQNPSELPKGEDYGIDGLYAAVDILQKTLGEVDGYQTDDGILEHKCAISAVKELFKQQKSSWSEDDEKFVHGLIRGLSAKRDIHGHTTFSSDGIDITKTIDWLKSLKDRVGCEVNCTTTKDWSEEDKDAEKAAEEYKNFRMCCGIKDPVMLNEIEEAYYEGAIRQQKSVELDEEDECNVINICAHLRSVLTDEAVEKYRNWLKSLRPQSHWKPSDEQMLALDSAIHCYAGVSPTNNREVYALEIMKEQLKKLRGE